MLESKRQCEPNEITWSNEIQEKLVKRQLKIENKTNEPKWVSKNKTIMDYAIKHVKNKELKDEILAPINQVRIHKRMMIPCELVGFSGDKSTKEMREKEARSSVIWKFKFDVVPKPSNRSYGTWEQCVKWLKEQRIIAIVDFEPWVQTTHETSSDKEHLKEKKENEETCYKKGEIRHSHQTYEKCESVIDVEWKKTIAEIKENGVLEVYGVFYVHQEESEIQYFQFNENITRCMKESKAVAATDASVKNGEMGGRWIISNKQKTVEISGELCHKKWNDNASGVAEVMTLLEVTTTLERRGKHIEYGKIEIGFDNRVQHRKLVENVKKSSTCAQEADAEIAMIKNLINKIKFE